MIAFANQHGFLKPNLCMISNLAKLNAAGLLDPVHLADRRANHSRLLGCLIAGHPPRSRPRHALDYLGNLIIVHGSRAARAGFVKQAITAILQESAVPLANAVFMDANFGSHRLAWQTIAHRRIARHRSDSDRATR
ncbi:hypothetical protein ABIB90_008186 [Bradyrhizobium sp. JR4.1]